MNSNPRKVRRQEPPVHSRDNAALGVLLFEIVNRVAQLEQKFGGLSPAVAASGDRKKTRKAASRDRDRTTVNVPQRI